MKYVNAFLLFVLLSASSKVIALDYVYPPWVSPNITIDISTVTDPRYFFGYMAAAGDINSKTVITLTGVIGGADIDGYYGDYGNTSWAGQAYRSIAPIGHIFYMSSCYTRINTYVLDPASDEFVVALAIHEIGHCLGMKHYPDVNEVMNTPLYCSVTNPVPCLSTPDFIWRLGELY